MRGESVTLFVPVDRDGFDIVWRKYVLRNVVLELSRADGKREGNMYVFYDKARFYRGGKRIKPFKIREGCAVAVGEDTAMAEQFVISLPPVRLMRVCAAEHFIRGSLRVNHTKLTLK